MNRGSHSFSGVMTLLLFVVLVSPLSAQSLDGEWRTTTTEHFRVHYPVEYEAWALRAAGRLESIREAVAAEVGWAQEPVVDVIVQDPVARANGSAWPFLDGPRMVLWTNPPGARSILRNYDDWGDLLMLHEETHLLHMLRPSRNRMRQMLALAFPLGPLTTQSPRWVTEGYATVVEGRLTGAGRPFGDTRAAILRQWARDGRLPGYGQLASGGKAWLGGSYAYLVGSAYLEWLVERTGPDSLRNLWRRMSAKKTRSFEEAFSGVFGDSPAKLYGRFTAELTWKAMELEKQLEGDLQEGEIWQEPGWTTGEPALSPDGALLAVVLHGREKRSRLVVLETGENEEGEKKFQEAVDQAMQADPQDVAAVRTRPLGRKPKYTLTTHAGGSPFAPRWMPDGESILFFRFDRDGDGFQRPDLWKWFPVSGVQTRVTRSGDVRDVDPAPDGRWGVGVRNRFGFSELVQVNLSTGEVTTLSGSGGKSIEVTYDQPRVSPDGRQVAFLRHAGDDWKLVVINLAERSETIIPTGDAGSPAYPAWSDDGMHLYASAGRNGFVDIWRFDLAGGGKPVRLTRSLAAAVSPVPDLAGNRLFFRSMRPDGFDIRTVSLPAVMASAEVEPDLAGLAPAVSPRHEGETARIDQEENEPGKPYRAGRQELRVILGRDQSGPEGQWQLGLRGGDVLGRLDWLVIGAFGQESGPEGAAAALTWRGWPVTVGVHLYGSGQAPSTHKDAGGLAGTALDQDQSGVELNAAWSRLWSAFRLDLTARGLVGSVRPAGGPSLSRTIGTLGGTFSHDRKVGRWSLSTGLLGIHQEGKTEDDTWRRTAGKVWFEIGKGRWNRIRGDFQRTTAASAVELFDQIQLGGMESSILPVTETTGRVFEPALPPGFQAGDEYEGRSLELGPFFYRDHRTWFTGGSPGERLGVAGFEFGLGSVPQPLLRLPGLRMRFGAAEVLDGPLDGDLRLWLNMVWRP